MSELLISDFAHIHLHAETSLLDGENRIPNVIARAKDLGLKQIALTDHGVMMGSLNFYKECKAAGIKPILGSEVYMTNDPDNIEKTTRTRDNYHLVLIAQNEIGYKNLLWLVSQAQLANFYSKPRISFHNLTPDRVEGLIASTACLGSLMNRTAGWNDEAKCYDHPEKIEEGALRYKQIFGDNLYLEIQDNDDAAGQQKMYNQYLIDIGKKHNIKIVITADAHYTTQEKSALHSMLMAMQLKKTIEEYSANGEMKYGPWFYIRSPAEMLEAARKYNCEEAFWNACKIGNDCEEYTIELGKFNTPEFNFSNEDDYQEFIKDYNNEEDH